MLGGGLDVALAEQTYAILMAERVLFCQTLSNCTKNNNFLRSAVAVAISVCDSLHLSLELPSERLDRVLEDYVQHEVFCQHGNLRPGDRHT